MNRYITHNISEAHNRRANNYFELCIATLTLLSLLGYCIGVFLNYSLPNENPFKAYYTNTGILITFAIGFIARSIFLISFYLMTFREKKFAKVICLFSAFTIGFLAWFELYYGSTFYYGEVRDKQGLGFPYLASIMFTFIIWKIQFSKTHRANLVAKIFLTSFINVALVSLWFYVQDSWKL